MLEVTGWCPLTTANTLAAFCMFQLRTDHLNDLEMPYLPESRTRISTESCDSFHSDGFGSVNQSTLSLKYIRWREKKAGHDLQHALSPRGEKVVILFFTKVIVFYL